MIPWAQVTWQDANPVRNGNGNGSEWSL